MTKSEIKSLPDAELVRLVEEKLIRNMNDPARCPTCGWPFSDNRATGCVPGDCSMRPVPKKPRWRPLESWDDAMMVRSAMQAKGWRFDLIDTSDGMTRAAVDNVIEGVIVMRFCDMPSEREKRAILECSLLAMEASR